MPKRSSTAKPKPPKREGTAHDFTVTARRVVEQAIGEKLDGSPLVATLTLNNDGECRLLVDGEELDRWQVLRRALEPVLFRPAN